MRVAVAAFREAHQRVDHCQRLSASAPRPFMEDHSVNGAEYCLLRWELHDKAKIHLAEDINIRLIDMLEPLYGI